MNTSATETAEAPVSSESKSGQSRRFKVVIVGGGTAGISVAARLCNAMPEPDVAIVEPSETHYYQPLWTLVGGGVVNKEKSARAESGLIPKGATWVRDSVTKLDPENDQVITAGGETIGYDFLVVACGIEINWDGVKGLAGAVGKNNICSNYDYDTVDYTWQTIKNFQGGTALFTMPPPPIKCAGAPQKIAYLADDAFRKQGVRDKSKIIYAAGTPGIFSAPAYAEQGAQHPGFPIIHDLMAAWETATGNTVEYAWSDSFGAYSVNRINGAGNPVTASLPPWWCYKVNGERVELGISLQPIAPGDVVSWDLGACP